MEKYKTLSEVRSSHVTRTIDGVHKADVQFKPEKATVTYEPEKVTVQQMIEAVKKSGFGANSLP